MTAMNVHRLDGLEPDNLLAFLAMLGLLRSLNQADATLHPRISWAIDEPPLRPKLHLAQYLEIEALTEKIALGIDALANHGIQLRLGDPRRVYCRFIAVFVRADVQNFLMIARTG